MWQERFTEMQAKVDKFLKAYKQDFEVDKLSLIHISLKKKITRNEGAINEKTGRTFNRQYA